MTQHRRALAAFRVLPKRNAMRIMASMGYFRIERVEYHFQRWLHAARLAQRQGYPCDA